MWKVPCAGSAGRQVKLRNTSSSIVLPRVSCAEEGAHIWKMSRRREGRKGHLFTKSDTPLERPRSWLLFYIIAIFFQHLTHPHDELVYAGRIPLSVRLAQPVPDPPSGLSVQVKSGKTAVISWNPPAHGSFTSFKLKINPLVHIADQKPQPTTIDNIDGTQYVLKDLIPGATYQVQAFTVFENKESAAYTSRNFTTSRCR
nr:unnamed protein product [Callosobruchus analis]